MGEGARSADRVMTVLRFLSGRLRPVPATVIARSCGLPRSSTYQLLKVMLERDFVTYYPDQHAWGLGPEVFSLGTAYLRREPLTWLGRPYLRDLSLACGVTSHLAILQGNEVLYLAKEETPSAPLRLISQVGLRLPAHLTAVGRAILMHLPRTHLEALFPLDQQLVRRTRRGPRLLGELERALVESRHRGYAVDEGLTTPGVTCVATTVFSHERVPLAAVGVAAAADRLHDARRRELIDRVVTTAGEISTALGFDVSRSHSPTTASGSSHDRSGSTIEPPRCQRQSLELPRPQGLRAIHP